MNTIREKLESNELIWEIQRRVNKLMTREQMRMTDKTRKIVVEVLDKERSKLRRHVEHTLK